MLENYKVFVSPAFHTRFPKTGRYFLLSRVGFDETRSRAMAWISRVCVGLCGNGTFYFMQREQDGCWSRAALGEFQNCSTISQRGESLLSRSRKITLPHLQARVEVGQREPLSFLIIP